MGEKVERLDTGGVIAICYFPIVFLEHLHQAGGSYGKLRHQRDFLKHRKIWLSTY